jgi:hypothetical protein
MTKQDAIKNAYLEIISEDEFNKIQIDNDGWYYNTSVSYIKIDIDKFDFEENSYFIRPKQLQGIEDNNGWISIESEKDLPKENGKYWFILKSNNEILNGNFSVGCFDYALRYYDEKEVTHYQPIILPSNPLY